MLAALPDVIGQTVGGLVAGGVAIVGRSSRVSQPDAYAGLKDLYEGYPGGGDFIDASYQDDAPANMPESDIIVIGRRLGEGLVERGRGILDWIDGFIGTNLGGNHPHTSDNNRNEYSDFASTLQTINMSIRSAANRVGDEVSYGVELNRSYYGNLFNNTLGPQSFYGRNVGQPFTRLVTPGLTMIADSPVADPGTWASIEAAHPAVAIPGSVGLLVSNGLKPFASIARFAPRAAPAIEGSVPLLSVAESGVWKLNPFARGQQIEQALGHNLPGNFPVIDRFENGFATSIKSLDLDAAAYQSSTTLNRTLTGYVDKVAGFRGNTWANVRIRSQDIAGRALDLAIPHGGSAAQQAIINQSVKYGASRGVTVNVITFP
jgi:hypothetical protein